MVVLDYGSGNLRSAERALARVGASVTVTADASLARSADGLVVPGVGAYAACMDGLLAVSGDTIIADRVSANAPILAICVGLQVLFEIGVEHGRRTAGLGVLPGDVTRLDAPVLPHMGWNTVDASSDSVLLAGLDPSTRFYFVHSYGVAPGDPRLEAAAAVSTSEHGSRFVSAVETGVVSATQFHPEKSADAGAALLENWLNTL